MSERVIIVGAGVGGLTTAALLAARGLDVTVVEAAAGPGGKLRQIDGIDAGPTVFTMRDVFEDIFNAAGGALADDVTLVPADTLARHHWPDGSSLDLFADPARSHAAIAAFAGADAARGYDSFQAEAKRIYGIVETPFMKSDKAGPFGLARRVGLTRISDMLAIKPITPLWKAIGAHFTDPRLRQLFGRYATYSGSSPFLAPATLMLIAHVEASGVWLVKGGMAQLAKGLEALAVRAGAAFRYGTPVATIDVDQGRAAGVTLSSGEQLNADHVVINADPAAIGIGRFGEAVRGAVPQASIRHRSLSAMVWLAKGHTTGQPLTRHNVFFSNDYKTEFDTIASGRVPTAPSVYMCAQDRGDAASAVPMSERFQFIVNAPANGDSHHYTSGEIEICRTQMLAALERCGLTLTPDSLSVLTPSDFERLNPATGGALYGRASHGWAASFLRPGARTKIPGVYCTGGSCHPGAGVPMAALSGRLTSAALLLDLASTATSRRAGIAGGMSTRSARTAVTG
jgi:1-hydroxycarotenoid 3,4-desaturase